MERLVVDRVGDSCYSSELRTLAVRHTVEQERLGRSLPGIAAELGVEVTTLSRWLKAESSFRLVELSTSESLASYVVVTPDGFRVEGVAQEDLDRVIRRLR